MSEYIGGPKDGQWEKWRSERRVVITNPIGPDGRCIPGEYEYRRTDNGDWRFVEQLKA